MAGKIDEGKKGFKREEKEKGCWDDDRKWRFWSGLMKVLGHR